MRREADPDFYCPQAALISEETVRRTEARLAKYRQKIQEHHQYLENQEIMLRNKQLVGQGVVIAASALVVVGLLRIALGRGGRCRRDDAKPSFPDDHYFDRDFDEERLEKDFEAAANTSRSFPDGYLDARDQLMLYGLYKQATVGDRTGDAPSKLNIVATEKYKAHGKFAGVPQPFAKMKYIEIVSHFADGGESSFIDAQNSHDDIVYEEDEAVDEDGCPLQGDEEFSGFGVRQSTLNNESAEIKGNETNDSRLRRAAIHSDEKLLKQAIDNGADVNGADESGQTALHFAADRGSIECIQLLIKHGASVNAADCDGISILFTAVMTGNLDVVKLLLENGANPDMEDKDGETPRAWVVDETDDMVKLFDAYPKIS